MELLVLIFIILLFAGMIIYSSFSWGFVLFKFWYWFLLPVFTTLPSVDFYQAVGLMFFISLLKTKSFDTPIKDEYIDNSKKISNIFTQILVPWIVLVIGFFVKSIIL